MVAACPWRANTRDAASRMAAAVRSLSDLDSLGTLSPLTRSAFRLIRMIFSDQESNQCRREGYSGRDDEGRVQRVGEGGEGGLDDRGLQ